MHDGYEAADVAQAKRLRWRQQLYARDNRILMVPREKGRGPGQPDRAAGSPAGSTGGRPSRGGGTTPLRVPKFAQQMQAQGAHVLLLPNMPPEYLVLQAPLLAYRLSGLLWKEACRQHWWLSGMWALAVPHHCSCQRSPSCAQAWSRVSNFASALLQARHPCPPQDCSGASWHTRPRHLRRCISHPAAALPTTALRSTTPVCYIVLLAA